MRRGSGTEAGRRAGAAGPGLFFLAARILGRSPSRSSSTAVENRSSVLKLLPLPSVISGRSSFWMGPNAEPPPEIPPCCRGPGFAGWHPPGRSVHYPGCRVRPLMAELFQNAVHGIICTFAWHVVLPFGMGFLFLRSRYLRRCMMLYIKIPAATLTL